MPERRGNSRGETVLVTGGAGFIGSNLVRYLLNHTSYRVVNADALTYAGNLRSLADVREDPRYQFEHVDIRNGAQVDGLVARHSPVAIIHLAAESHVDRSIDGPAEFVETNVVGTFHLLQAARKLFNKLSAEAKPRFRFVHVSTDEVFGSLQPDDPAFSETTRYDPHSPYSATKASSDHLARAWHTSYGLPVLVTNCSNNYGPYQFPEKLVPIAILKALRGEHIPVYGRGENVRDWLYVEDHAAALTCILEHGRVGETYLIGGNNEQRNIDLVRQLCRVLDELHPRAGLQSHEALISFVPDRPGHDLRYAIDSSKLRRELGWQPRETSETGLRKTVQWYLDNHEWWSAILDGSYRLERLGLSKGDT